MEYLLLNLYTILHVCTIRNMSMSMFTICLEEKHFQTFQSKNKNMSGSGEQLNPYFSANRNTIFKLQVYTKYKIINNKNIKESIMIYTIVTNIK